MRYLLLILIFLAGCDMRSKAERFEDMENEIDRGYNIARGIACPGKQNKTIYFSARVICCKDPIRLISKCEEY